MDRVLLRMNRILRILPMAAIAAGTVTAQAPPRDPTESPASQRPPRTVTPQTYPNAQIQAGELRFTSQCGFCHGRDAAGGETGPDLTRSKLVAEDNRGDKIVPLVRSGRPEQGMPAFSLSDADLAAIVAFIHDQKTKAEALGGGRRSVDAADLATGDAAAGRRYFKGAGGCSACHSATGDLPESPPDIMDWLCCSACFIPAAGPLRRRQTRYRRTSINSGNTPTPTCTMSTPIWSH